MARGKNQKLKMLYLAKLFIEQTDENHGITMPEIIAYLEKYDIDAQRKSIYSDIDALVDFGYDIIKEQRGKLTYYFLASRDFEVPELKLLVDAIQSSRFITTRKSRELIRKLETLVSEHDAKLLDREVYVAGRIKNMNESIYYGIDSIHSALNNNHKIRFHYFRWNVRGEQELGHNGDYYVVSPWALTWDNENYYLVAYDEDRNQLRHYRVDKMKDISELDEKRAGASLFKEQDKAVYTEKRFNMFNGEVKRVKLKCKNHLSNVIVDHFGLEERMRPLDENHFTVNVDVAVSPHFLGWLVALGDDVEILEPTDVVEEMKSHIDRIRSLY